MTRSRPAPEPSGAGLDALERSRADTSYTSTESAGTIPAPDASGVPDVPGTPDTLQEGITAFLFHCRYEKNLSPKTLSAYGTDLRQFAEHVATVTSRTELVAIDKQVLRSYVQALSGRFGEESTRRKVATLNAFFAYLEREDAIQVNPLRKLSIRLRRTRRLPRTIPLEELQALFRHMYALKAHATGVDLLEIVRDIAVLEVLFATAARVTEVAHLRVTDVDAVAGTVRVLGKGRRERVLSLCDASAVQALREYLELARPNPNSGFFFRNRRNNRLSEASIRGMIRNRANRAGIGRRLTPHMFRHSVATMLLEAGVDIRLIQSVLGHASISTTQLYTAVHDSFQHKVLAASHPRRKI